MIQVIGNGEEQGKGSTSSLINNRAGGNAPIIAQKVSGEFLKT
jgi:hypothetical protein